MPIDPSIYANLRPSQPFQDPLQQYGALMSLRAMGDASQLHGMQRQQLQKTMSEDDAASDAYRQAGGVREKLMALLSERGLYKHAIAAEKAGLEIDEKKSNIKKNAVETHGKEVAQWRDLLATTNDDVRLRALTEATARLYGPDEAAALPKTVSDPAFAKWKETQLMTADEAVKAMTPKMEKVQIDDGGKITTQMIDVNPVTNPGVKNLKIVTDKVATPGEKLTDARSRETANQPVWDEARGVFVARPGAAAAAAPGAPAAAAAPAAPGFVRPAGLPPKPSDVHTIRNEFNTLPEVKAYRDVIPVVEAARTAPDTRAGDLQLAYAVGKVLDPNSVVREGEFKMAQDVTAPQQKLWAEVQSAVTGSGRMTPEVRGQLVKLLDNAVNAREGAYKQAESTYKGIAEKNGIPVDQVIITPQTRKSEPAKPEPGKPTMFDAPPDPAKYTGKRLQSDDGTVYVSDGKRWVRQASKAVPQ